MAEQIRIQTPLTEEQSRKLKAGDMVLISGKIYSARDAAHKVMTEALARGEELPIDWHDKIVYYLGPSPAKPGIQSVPLVLQHLVVWMLTHQQCLIKVSKA